MGVGEGDYSVGVECMQGWVLPGLSCVEVNTLIRVHTYKEVCKRKDQLYIFIVLILCEEGHNIIILIKVRTPGAMIFFLYFLLAHLLHRG